MISLSFFISNISFSITPFAAKRKRTLFDEGNPEYYTVFIQKGKIKMQRIYYQIPLYRFLQYCSEYDISRSVLDCGAGGDTLGNHQYYQYDDDMPVILSYFEETEADIWFQT